MHPAADHEYCCERRSAGVFDKKIIYCQFRMLDHVVTQRATSSCWMPWPWPWPCSSSCTSTWCCELKRAFDILIASPDTHTHTHKSPFFEPLRSNLVRYILIENIKLSHTKSWQSTERSKTAFNKVLLWTIVQIMNYHPRHKNINSCYSTTNQRI
jgi:hypothetical protein